MIGHRLIGGFAAWVSLLLAGLILWQSMVLLPLKPAQPDNSRNEGAVLLLHGHHQAIGQYSLFQAGITEAGLSWMTWPVPEGEYARADSLEAAVRSLADTAGCTAADVWLAASGSTARDIWDAACRLPQAAGMILFIPEQLSSLSGDEIRLWPTGRSLALFTGQFPAGGREEDDRWFFEQLTGEDASLFPGYQPGPGQPIQYLTADGRIGLMQYPILLPMLTLLSPRILPDALGWIMDSKPDAGADQASRKRSALELLMLLPVGLILAGLLLLTALAGLNLFLTRRLPARSPAVPPDPAAGTDNRVRRTRFSWLLELAVWLPGLILAAALGWLAAWLSTEPTAWLFWSLAVLPGCHGWIMQIIRLIRQSRRRRLHPEWTSQTGQADAAGPHPGLPELPDMAGLHPRTPVLIWLPAGLTLLLILILSALLVQLTFGTILPSSWNWLYLPVLILLNWPAGLAGTVGRIGAIWDQGSGSWPDSGKANAIWQHLPLLLLPIWAGLSQGWPGLIAGLGLLMVHVWSVGLGKAATLLSFHAGAGSLVQALGYSAGILLPPIVQGFFH